MSRRSGIYWLSQWRLWLREIVTSLKLTHKRRKSTDSWGKELCFCFSLPRSRRGKRDKTTSLITSCDTSVLSCFASSVFTSACALTYAAVTASPPCIFVCILWLVSPLWMFNSRPGLCLCAQNGTPRNTAHLTLTAATLFYIHSFAEPPHTTGFHCIRPVLDERWRCRAAQALFLSGSGLTRESALLQVSSRAADTSSLMAAFMLWWHSLRRYGSLCQVQSVGLLRCGALWVALWGWSEELRPHTEHIHG